MSPDAPHEPAEAEQGAAEEAAEVDLEAIGAGFQALYNFSTRLGAALRDAEEERRLKTLTSPQALLKPRKRPSGLSERVLSV